MIDIDEKIRLARIELSNARRDRWEDQKNFYSIMEELKCGISILRSRMQTVLDSGVDFDVIQDSMQEVNTRNEVPYVALHFGHQVLLVSALHQMEVLKRLLKLTATQGKAMANFFDEAKRKQEEESSAISLLLYNTYVESESFIIDDRLAQAVVAQRLVIRKLRTILGENKPSASVENPITLGTVIEVPVLLEDSSTLYDWSLDESCLSIDCVGEVSPRYVKSFVPMCNMESNLAKIEMQCMPDVKAQSKGRWKLSLS
jgi:hypothetical protein